jgi:hypothetical protein
MSIASFSLANPSQVLYGALAAWWFGGILAIVIPLAKWRQSREAYYNLFGRYIEYQNAQRQAERNQNQNNQMYSYNGYTMKNCSWWQWGCRRQQYKYHQQYDQYMQQNGGGQAQRQVYTPRWYNFLGGKMPEEDNRHREEMGFEQSSGGGVKFVYAWSLVMFVALLLYASFVMYRQYQFRDKLTFSVGMVWVLLLTVFQYSFLMLVLVPQGVIETDDRDLENFAYGWYGQFPILLAYFQFAVALFSGISLLLLTGILYYVQRVKSRSSSVTEVVPDVSKSDKIGKIAGDGYDRLA